jgi:glycosyltransferase involved in cell wall biosynthesis
MTKESDRQASAKHKCVFVGSFQPASDGTVGGQLFACRSLIDSPISNFIEFVLIDSTQRSLPPPSLPTRFLLAVQRTLRFFIASADPSVRSSLIFSSFRFFSLAEKMTMAIFGRLARKRVVISFRSEITNQISGYVYIYFLVRIGIACADNVICQSHEAESSLATLFPTAKTKIKVIPNWIDTSAYSSIAERRISSGSQPTPRRAVRILFLGWIERFKGVHTLAEAFRSLILEGHDIAIDFVGSGSQIEELSEFFRQCQLTTRVVFHGWLSGQDKLNVVEHADIVVLPSLSEGMPNALLEAMAAGLPVVASSVGGIPDLVKDGYSGVLVSPNDPIALASALKRFAESRDIRISFGLNGYREVESHHSVRSVWPAVAELLTGGRPL